VLVVAAPPGFRLEPLPGGVTLHSRPGRAPYDVVLAFCPDRAALERRFDRLKALLGPASALWVSWPKRASGVVTDLDENGVRGHALAHGLVDVKVAAVDDVWSGLKLVYRLSDRSSVSSTQA